MSHIYKASEWQSCNQWHIADTSDIKNHSNAWWIPMRLLDLDVDSFILLLKDTYYASHFHYNQEANVLTYSWDKYTDAHKWLLYINRVARNRNYKI